MITINNFKFRINVSVDTYTTKKESTACLSRIGAKAIGKKKMAFVEMSLSVSEFLQLAISGHTFCNLFDIDPNKKYWVKTTKGNKYQAYPVYMEGPRKGAMKLTFKRDEFFKGAQVIFVDVDNTRFLSVEDYIGCLTYKPTAVYMSFSDKLEKRGIVSRRFRLVYVFARILNKQEFQSISQSITDHIIFDTAEPMEDDCGTRMSQFMNGVYGNNEVYQTDLIYIPEDFPTEDNVVQDAIQEDNETLIAFDEQLLRDMGTLGYDQFMHFYSLKYRYVYRIERPEWIDNEYQLTDDNYLQLWYYREKQVDGQHRRRKLFKNACLRRLMYPEIDCNTLLINLYVDFVRFFDNSDGAITLDVLIRKVKNAMLKSPEQLAAYCDYEIKYWASNRPKFITNPRGNFSLAHINKIAKKIRWKELDDIYDRNKSILENHQLISECSLATLYRYCEDRLIDRNPNRKATKIAGREEKRLQRKEKRKLFESLYDPELSIRDNKKMMEEMGLTISIGTIQKWSREAAEEEISVINTLNTFGTVKLDIPNSWWSSGICWS